MWSSWFWPPVDDLGRMLFDGERVYDFYLVVFGVPLCMPYTLWILEWG